MTRGLVLGFLLLFLAGWLAPVPVQAMGLTRAAAEAEAAPLYRALALTAVAQTLLLAGESAAAQEMALQARAVAWTRETRAKAE